MSIPFTWTQNQLKLGTFYARVIPTSTDRSEDIISRIAERTLIAHEDCNAVLDGLDAEILKSLRAGRAVILDDFLGFNVSIELADPDAATSPKEKLDKDDYTLRLNVTPKPAWVRGLETAEIVKTETSEARPSLLEVLAWGVDAPGSYAPGLPIEITGNDLTLPEDFLSDATQGVFLIASDGTEYRAEVYRSATNRRIACVAPAGVSGTVDIEVRTRYKEGGPAESELAIGRIKDIAMAAS